MKQIAALIMAMALGAQAAEVIGTGTAKGAYGPDTIEAATEAARLDAMLTYQKETYFQMHQCLGDDVDVDPDFYAADTLSEESMRVTGSGVEVRMAFDISETGDVSAALEKRCRQKRQFDATVNGVKDFAGRLKLGVQVTTWPKNIEAGAFFGYEGDTFAISGVYNGAHVYSDKDDIDTAETKAKMTTAGVLIKYNNWIMLGYEEVLDYENETEAEPAGSVWKAGILHRLEDTENLEIGFALHFYDDRFYEDESSVGGGVIVRYSFF